MSYQQKERPSVCVDLQWSPTLKDSIVPFPLLDFTSFFLNYYYYYCKTNKLFKYFE